jgi:hypothetical protein
MSSTAIQKSDTKFERILASYLDEGSVELTAPEIEIRDRAETAFSLLLNWRSREQAVKVLESQYDISKATAYRDINRALSLYGDITKSRKEGWRYIIFEYNQKLFQMSVKEKALDQMGKCLDRMIKLAQLDQEESTFNPEKFIAQTYELTVANSVKMFVEKSLKKGAVDLNDYVSENAEDTTYEDVDK